MKLLLLLIILIGAFFRFYQLNNFPVQLNHDEITQLYDAISIAQTGRDIYGNFLPTMFVSINDFKPPFYTYITAVTYLIFGNHEVIIRLPSAFFGTILVLVIFYFTKNIFKNDKIAIFASIVTAVSPFEIFFSRKGFESGIGIFFVLLGFTLLLIYIKKKYILSLMAGLIFLAFSMYVYFAQAVLVPLFLLGFLWLFWGDVKKAGLKRWLLPLALWFVLITPLIWIIISDEGSRYRSQTVFLIQDVNLGKQLELGGLQWQVIFDYALNKYLKQFDPIYMFGNGLDLTNQGPLSMGPLYLFQLPFLLLGVYFFIKMPNLTKEKKFICSLVVLGMLPSGLTFEDFSLHRSIIVFTMLNILSAVGMANFVDWLYGFRKRRFLLAATSSLVTVVITLNIAYFLHMYFVNYPFEKSQSIQYPFKQVALYAWSKHNEYDQIVFDPYFGQAAPIIGTGAHYYFGYYGNYLPSSMQKEYRIGMKPREVLFDKFSIRKIEWNDDIKLQNTLLILSSWTVDPKILDKNRDRIVQTFYFYDKQSAFYAINYENP